MIINVKNIPELTDVPKQGTTKSAAYDVIAVSEPEIVGEKAGDYWKRIDYIQYHTALYTAPQKYNYGSDHHILIHPRSSVSKYNLVLANGIGLVDSDYRGEMLVRYKYIWQPEDLKLSMTTEKGNIISGIVNTDRIYKKGDKVAQLVVEPTTEAEWVRVENLDETVRGTGAFGSTDTIPIGMTANSTESIKQNKLFNQKPLPVSKIVEHEKAYETRIDLIEQWKKAGGIQDHLSTNYETLIKEREKQLGTPK